MAVRSTMATLNAYVRRLISDPKKGTTGATSHFTTQEVQDQLDINRMDISEMRLLPKDVVTPINKYIIWKTFYAQVGFWESDAQLQGNDWQVLTPTKSDYLIGIWSFTSESQLLPVYVTGKIYDVFGAAADLCEQWAMSVALSYDMMTDMMRFQRSQMQTMLLKMADRYRTQQSIGTFETYRHDSTGSGIYRRYYYANDPSLGTF